MLRNILLIAITLIPISLKCQEKALQSLLTDSSMYNSSVSLCILSATDGKTVYEFNPERSLVPASVLKLVTTSAALELLGPDYTFKSVVSYTGSLNKSTGKLTGDIVITGGGDPALGSSFFRDHYTNFLNKWIGEIKKAGIEKIEGRVISDDSRYDYQPIPPKWLWEDEGNYYGAGVYGISIFDNTYEIHLRTNGEGTVPSITKVVPEICRYNLSNYLTSSGTSDEGFVFASPYSNTGWISGSVSQGQDDFILKASIPDPPLLLAQLFELMLDSAGITVSKKATTKRIQPDLAITGQKVISEIKSPPLYEIIEVLNHESVNLFAENLLKEMGYVFRKQGSTSAGLEVISKYLKDTGIYSYGFFPEDGSGVSPMDAITSKSLAELLVYNRNHSDKFNLFYNSLPEAGREGTLKNHFKDPLFTSNLRAKSGSMTRVRSYAGYLRTLSGNELAFAIIINNFAGPSKRIITGIEEILKETIQER